MKVNSPIRSPIILGRGCGMTTRALAEDLTAVSGDLQLIHNKYRKVQHFTVKKYTVTQRLALKPFLFAAPIDQQMTSGRRLCGIWCLQTTLWSAVRGGGMPRREKRMKVNRKKTRMWTQVWMRGRDRCNSEDSRSKDTGRLPYMRLSWRC